MVAARPRLPRIWPASCAWPRLLALACMLLSPAIVQGCSVRDDAAAANAPSGTVAVAKEYYAPDQSTPSKSLEIDGDGDLTLVGLSGHALGRARLTAREREDTERLWRAALPPPSPPRCDAPAAGVSAVRLVLTVAGGASRYDVRLECPNPRPILDLSSWVGALYRLHFDELTRTPSLVTTDLGRLPPAVRLARGDLAMRLALDADRVVVDRVEERLWPDTCLGLPAPELCAPGETPGYRVVLEALGRAHVYHTDEGTTFRPET
jgi:hypothetical protein